LVIHVFLQIFGAAGLMPNTLTDENLEDETIVEDELGSWKLPLELHKWLKASRGAENDHTGRFLLFMRSLWGLVLVYIW
jgi:hypothetical protein